MCRHTNERCPDGIDFAAFYLDDGVVAGSREAVQTMLSSLRTLFASVGLEFNVEKTIASPPPECQNAVPMSPWTWQADANIKVLGAPVGSDAFVRETLQSRAADATLILNRIKDLDCPQTAMGLARMCGAAVKMQYSMRTTPSDQCEGILQDFDCQVRRSVESILGQPLEQDEWARAARGVRFAGLGFRPAASHAPGAFWASVHDGRELVHRIWPQAEVENLSLNEEAVLGTWCSRELLDRARTTDKKRQKSLSDALDRSSLDAECTSPSTSEHVKAHLKLVQQDGTDQWLVAPPCSDHGTLLDGELFRISAKRRIRARFCTTHASCPLCGDALDLYMDHALVCPCGGDRTVRHNLVCKDLTSDLKCLGLNPVQEKPGLLPIANSDLEGNAGNFRSVGRNGRRPADVWIPLWENGRGTAVDTALTSGLAGSWLQKVVQDPNGPTVFYEEHKRNDRDTESHCEAQGFHLLPLIVEAHSGAFGGNAAEFVRQLGKRRGAQLGSSAGLQTTSIVSRIQATLRRETARAILRRASANMESLPRLQ